MHALYHTAEARKILDELISRLKVAAADKTLPPGAMDKIIGLAERADAHVSRASIGVKAAFGELENAAVVALSRVKSQVIGNERSGESPAAGGMASVMAVVMENGGGKCGNPTCPCANAG